MIEKYVNKIINGDCMDIIRQIPDKSIDLVLTDPPYGTTACTWDRTINFNELWKEVSRIRKDKCPCIFMAQEPFASHLRVSNIDNYKYDWIWEKQKASNFMSMKHQPARYHELVCVFYKHNYYPIMWEAENVDKRKTINNNKTNKNCHLGDIKRIRNPDTGMRYPKSILKINKSVNRNIHPTQKPVALMEYIIKTYTKENDLVLDCFSGSGTTAVACHNLKRRFICIEKDKDYYESSVKRLDECMKHRVLF